MPKGQVVTTDRQIIDDYKSGKFIREISHKRHTGLNRIRAALDREGLRKGEAVQA
ncbi:hypothetical protein [Methanoregula sp.]|uniref:hypothetical protein n=1 Tax=Methanoregula sp. TaxID=2052170 RepID=UPI0025DB49DA|nr:hypothetical protein [Methanoregula sp.]